MLKVINGESLRSGFRSKIEGVGGSVASARAANVSMMRFSQSSWTAPSTDSCSVLVTAEMKVSKTAVMLTVI